MKVRRDDTHSETLEQEAARAGVSYVKLGGSIGCVANGAQLAMTMKGLLENLGGHPAVFVDIEGATDDNTVGRAIELLLSDPDVKVAWLSFSGAALRCDAVARALLGIVRERHRPVPFVVSLQGPNADEARELLTSGPMTLMLEPDLERAARLAVASSGVPASKRKGEAHQGSSTRSG
jgi:succinyl-CoA synthetase beta subunit